MEMAEGLKAPMPALVAALLFVAAAAVIWISVRYPRVGAGFEAAGPFLAALLAVLLAAGGVLSFATVG